MTTTPELLVLERDALRVEVVPRPFAFTIRRRGRRLIRAGGVWVADGSVRDTFVQFTEGVIAQEELSPVERARRAETQTGDRDGIVLGLALDGGRRAELKIALVAHDRAVLTLTADGEPLRLAIDWDRRSEERFVGLGARHCTQFDQAGRTVQLGADRRYTGPDCPPEMLAAGGIPQGDCAPMPWLLSSRGYGAWVKTFANGTRFELAGERVSASTRALAGPLEIELLCAPTPAARLRQFCRLTGFPELLPEWGYGFWKSRDVHEHQDDVLDDFHGFRRNAIPLDAIVIDSPWATQYNTWEFNQYQFPDAPGMIRMMRADGVRTVVWCTPWVNLDSPGRTDSAANGVRAAAPRASAELCPGRGRRALRAGFWRRAARAAVVDGHRLAGRLHERGGADVVAGLSQTGARARGRGDQGRRRGRLLHP